MDFLNELLSTVNRFNPILVDWNKFHDLVHMCPRAALVWLKAQVSASILGKVYSMCMRSVHLVLNFPSALKRFFFDFMREYHREVTQKRDEIFYSQLFGAAKTRRWSYLDDSSPPDVGMGTVSLRVRVPRSGPNVIGILGASVVLYGGYRLLKFQWKMWNFQRRQDAIHAAKTRTAFLEQEYQEVKECMEEMGRQALRTRMEDCILKDVIVPEELDESGTVVTKEVSQFLMTHYGKFVRQLVAMAKVEFCGVPKNTEANQLAVWRFMYRCCEKRGLNILDTNRALSLALPFAFLPSQYDQNMAITMNCEDTVKTLQAYRDAFAQKSSLHRLLDNPLSGLAWREWARSVFYGDQSTGLHFAK